MGEITKAALRKMEGEPSKSDIEFSRYKQECRKRALDLAHQQMITPAMQKFIEDNEFSSDGKHTEKPIILDELLMTLADKYYNWLISIPQ